MARRAGAAAFSTPVRGLARLARLVLAAWCVAGLVPALAAPARAGELQEDLRARRARLMAQLDARTIFVAWSATPKVYSRDFDYEYRQDSKLLYLTAVDQEDTILVLMPRNLTRKEVLFIRDPDPRREHWEGHALTEQEARALTGIEAVYFVSQFEAFIASMFNREPFGEPRGVPESEYQPFFDAVEKGEAKLALFFGPKPEPSAPLTRAHEFAARAREWLS